ncbi:hypothetical protein [Pengzhenrongella sicca]|uniref:Uncharacterized protein n=1 Tax=Pengzhenrongella sicca TaxID=2819238 RepID=A0A8A4ZCX6_9MICO|nr:hypothetical protein [Pengzhenrongella sicca]QTE29792.1 hypothetical protein J4E96_01765 [Pengzhenrongella sicca]
MSPILAGAAALIPSAGVAFLFYLAIRALVNADRTERAALARLDALERASADPAQPRRDSPPEPR